MIIKYTKELLDSYCQENNIVLIKDYSNEKMNRETIIRGKCLTNDCENIFENHFFEKKYLTSSAPKNFFAFILTVIKK